VICLKVDFHVDGYYNERQNESCDQNERLLFVNFDQDNLFVKNEL